MPTRLNPSNFGYQNFYSSTLTGDITAGTLTIGLATVPSPSSGILIIEPDSTTNREVIVYTSKGASTITCPTDGRGYSGTSASAHLTGSTVIMAPVDKWFTALASGELSTDPLRTESFYDYIASGMVWSGDSYGSTRNASMTAGVMYIGGRRLTASLVTSRSFTASKDTYIDASDNGDGTVLLTYTEVANNAASPALAANSVRIGIIVTGAANIANAGSVNQGQQDKVLPIASSIAYSVTDSLGNLIFPTDPLRKIIGYRQITSNATGTTVTDIAGLNVTVNVPSGRKIKVTGFIGGGSSSAANNGVRMYLVDVTAGATIAVASNATNASGDIVSLNPTAILSPAAGTRTFKAQIDRGTNAATASSNGSATNPNYIMVELV